MLLIYPNYSFLFIKDPSGGGQGYVKTTRNMWVIEELGPGVVALKSHP